MEAGYDYLLLRGRLQRHLLNFPAIFLISIGLILMAGGGAYYGYAAKARADLDQLNVSLSSTNGGPLESSDPSASNRSDMGQPLPPPGVLSSNAGLQLPYSGDILPVEVWRNPLSYQPASYDQQAFLQGFTPIDRTNASPVCSHADVTRISVPALGIDSSVQELAILDLGDSRAYETPVNTVGHIPESANPGEAGSSWFFGHLESPVLGEGSVFYNLPQIAEMLRKGQEVYVATDNGADQYLYRFTSTRVVHQDDMRLEDEGVAAIHLVACVPRLVYDHRLIVTGELAGVK